MEKFSTDSKMLEHIVIMMKAMADPNRLRIMDVLMEGEACNCEVKDRFGLPANLLSHHLRVLKKAGLVDSRRDAVDGRWIYYHVDKEALEMWQTWMQQFFNSDRIQNHKKLCGPEGQNAVIDTDFLMVK